MVIRGKLTLDLLSSQLQEGLGQWCLAVCKGQVPGSFTMLSVITSPGYFHEYPKLETPGLGSFLREVCASDKEYCPEGEEYNFYIKELTFSRTHQSFWVPWSLCFSYWSWSSNKSHSCLLHGFNWRTQQRHRQEGNWSTVDGKWWKLTLLASWCGECHPRSLAGLVPISPLWRTRPTPSRECDGDSTSYDE